MNRRLGSRRAPISQSSSTLNTRSREPERYENVATEDLIPYPHKCGTAYVAQAFDVDDCPRVDIDEISQPRFIGKHCTSEPRSAVSGGQKPSLVVG